MSEPVRKKPRITEDLRALGRIIHQPNTPKQRTPNKDARASSAGPNKIYVRTPGSTAAQTPTAQTPPVSARTRRQGSVRRGVPTTPHAIRALQQRRNAVLASGGNRRRISGRMQRETPRDDLRALSRLLAKKPNPRPSPQEATPHRRRSSLVDQVDDSPAVGQAPRLSLPLGDLEDDSFHEQPPRLSYPLDDDDDEIETRRRAALSRDRQSMGSIADPSFADLNELGPGEYEDVAEQRRQLLGQDISIHMDADDEDGETAELRAMLEARRQSGQTGDLTDITDGEPTFLFRIPERSRLSLAPSVPRAPQDQIVEDEFEDIEPDVLGGAEVDYDDVPSDAGEYELDEAPLREDFVPLPDDDHHHHHQGQAEPAPKKMHKRLTKELKVSRYGIDYPSFPPSVVKRLANTFSRSYGGSGKLNKDTLAAIQQATDWFFEQVSEDLASYADHAGRKTIEEADVVTLMKRQRLLNQNTTLFSLASKYLPRELLQNIRMVPQVKAKKRKRARARMEPIEEE